jgi:microcystin degradation protein MlrC
MAAERERSRGPSARGGAAPAGPDVPIVVSLDLNGILTARMMLQCDIAVVYRTYELPDCATGRQRDRPNRAMS